MSAKNNKRLNNSDRELLRNFVRGKIACETEQEIFEKAYKAAKIIVLNVVRKRFPMKDMKLLQKYEAAKLDGCINYGGYYDTDSQFRFHLNDKDIPLVPKNGSCNQRHYEWSKDDHVILSAYQLARQALKKAKNEKTNAYERLIIGSTTFNDIVAVWPAAEILRSKIIPQNTEQRALAVLSEDVIAMIKADNAGSEVQL
jgi:transposase